MLFPACLILSALIGTADAVRAPGDYRAMISEELTSEVTASNQQGQYREAVKLAGRITRGVGRFATLSYEAGYAHSRLGELDMALQHFDRALDLDPRLAVAWYDRGEIHLERGDLVRAFLDFEAVVRLRPEHWAGHFRLAHLAGLSGKVEALERHLVDAIRTGFELETLAADPDWRSFSRDPELGVVLRKVIVLYGDEALLKRLRETP